MKTVNWGIIGCGDVTEVKSGPAFSLIGNSNLMAVMRRNEHKAADYARRHGVPAYYSDAEQLIHDEQVNAVYVATPPDSHAYYTIQALKAGKPVYCEKPMAMHYQDCMDMIHAAESSGMPLFVAYYRRGLEAFVRVKEMLSQGMIGTVRHVSVQLVKPPDQNDFLKEQLPWRVDPVVAGGGYFVDLAPHQIDILQFLLGDIREVSGIAVNQAGLYPAEDTVVASFSFSDGPVGTGLWSFVSDKKAQTDCIELTGDKGRIRFSCFDQAPLVVQNDRGEQSFSFAKPAHIQQPFIQSVVNELTGQGGCPGNLKHAANTNWFMDEVLRSYYQKHCGE